MAPLQRSPQKRVRSTHASRSYLRQRPNRAATHTAGEHAMNVMNDQDPSTFSPRADDVTTASAWSSSPLGDPADEAEYHPHRYNFPPDPITPAAGPKSISKATLAAGLVGTIGVGAALAMAIFVYTDSSQVRPMTVVPGSNGVPAAFPPGGRPTSAA